MRNAIVLVLAVLGAGITMFMAYNFVSRPPPTPVVVKPIVEVPPTIPTSKVLVAKKDLGVGTFIREEDLIWQDWPDQSVSPAYVVEQKKNIAETGKKKKVLTIKDFTGAVVRQPIAAGQPLSIGMVGRPGERGFLAAVLQPGMRAYSVSASATSSVSGFILPGDRVDILWKASNRQGKPFVQTLMSDVRVIAINKLTRATGNTSAGTITFELTPKKVQALHLATGLGSLNYVLRSIAPEQEKDKDGTESVLLADASEGITMEQLLSGANFEAKSVFDQPPVEKEAFTLPDELYYDRNRPKPKKKKKKTGTTRVATTRRVAPTTTSKTAKVTIVRGSKGSTVKVRSEP